MKTKISFFFWKSQDLKHSKMFFRGSSGSGSTGVVTLYMTKLSREVRRNSGSGPSQRWSILFYFIFLYLHSFHVVVRATCLSRTNQKEEEEERKGRVGPKTI